MKKFVLFMFATVLTLTVNAQDTFTDVITPDKVDGLGSSATIATYVGEGTGIEYTLRCTVVDDGTAFHFNGNATGYQIWTSQSKGYYIRKVTIVGSATTNETALRLYGKDSEWTLGSGGYPESPVPSGTGGTNVQGATAIGTITLKQGEAASLNIDRYNFEYLDIFPSETANNSGGAAEFTSITLEWEEIDETATTFESITPADGSEINRSDNVFVMTFSGNVAIYNGYGEVNGDENVMGSYINSASRQAGKLDYYAFESLEPAVEGAEFSKTWTFTVPQDILEDWPAESSEVPFTFVVYAYNRDGGAVQFTDDDGNTTAYYTASYTILDDEEKEPVVKPDVYTDPNSETPVSALRTVTIYCDEGITVSDYSVENDDGSYTYYSPDMIYVKDESGAEVARVTGYNYVNETSLGSAYAGLGVQLNLSKAIKTAGTYTVVVPEYIFVLGSEEENWENNIYNDEFYFDVTVDGTEEGMLDYTISPRSGTTLSGISDVTVTFDGEVWWDDSYGYGNAAIYDETGTSVVVRADDAKEVMNGGKVVGYTFTFGGKEFDTGRYIFRIGNGIIRFEESKRYNNEIEANYRVVVGVLDTGTVLVSNKVAYSIGEDLTAGVLFQANYLGYEGVDASGAIEIPAVITDEETGVEYDVIGMAPRTYYENEDITSITINAHITNWSWAASETAATGSNFYGCVNLAEVKLDGLTSLQESMFNGCTSLVEVEIPSGVRELPTAIFSYCDALETLSLPETMTSLGSSTFRGCNRLKDIYCYAATPPATITQASGGGYITFNGCPQNQITLHVYCDFVEVYEESEYWGAYTWNEEPISYIKEVVGIDCPDPNADYTLYFNPAPGTVTELGPITLTCEGGLQYNSDYNLRIQFTVQDTMGEDIGYYEWLRALDPYETNSIGNITSLTMEFYSYETFEPTTITADGIYTLTLVEEDPIELANGDMITSLVLTYYIGDVEDTLYDTVCNDIADLYNNLETTWTDIQVTLGDYAEELKADYEAILDSIDNLKASVDDYYAAGALADNMTSINADIAAIQAAIDALDAEATGINKIAVTSAAKNIYTLTGQKVNAPTSKGVYIIDGKKVLVK